MTETWLRRHYSPCIMNSYVTSLLCERQKALFCFSFLKIFIAKCCQGVFHGTTFYNPCLEFSTCLQLMKRHTSTELRIPSSYFPRTRGLPFWLAGELLALAAWWVRIVPLRVHLGLISLVLPMFSSGITFLPSHVLGVPSPQSLSSVPSLLL